MRLHFLFINCVALLMLAAYLPLIAQVNRGEVRLSVLDPAGSGLKASITLASSAFQYKSSFMSTSAGELDIQNLAYGSYLLLVKRSGFESFSEVLEVRSALPTLKTVKLGVATVQTSVEVNGAPLIDPYSSSTAARIGSQQIQERVASLPGRSIQDLINSQPGWIYEGNAVLHPRGSEYQTQFVVDGIPLTDNRSPGSGPEIEADDVDTLTAYTAGIPAEYGKKLGGVVEVDTFRENVPGLHGQVVLAGGSYGTASSYAQFRYGWKKSILTVSASRAMSAHYLNPVVPENYTNRGTTGDFAVHYEREFTDSDRLHLQIRHELSRFEVPNEYAQQQAGQLQTGGNVETFGSASYEHIASPNGLFKMVGMVRDRTNDLDSNTNSTPIIAEVQNHFREGYFKTTYTLHRGTHEFKAGLESDATFLREHFNYLLTDATQFDSETPLNFQFAAHRPDLEQGAFVEDTVRLGEWTISAGLRWDHYQLLLNQNAFSPRIAMSRAFTRHEMAAHVSFDRIYQTPSSTNILFTSSNQIHALSTQFLHLPVQPSRGNYYEAGATKAILHRISVAANLYRRNVRNFADDDQLLNTSVSYPIAFANSVVYGAEGKVTLAHLEGLSGFVSYSYMVANVWFPVTGGLFLGDNANSAATQRTGHFPASQDQRNTIRTRFQYRVAPRLWVATGLSAGSGLPFAYTGTRSDALGTYGQRVVDRINFSRGRILPALAVNGSVGLDLYKNGHISTRFQADGDNLNDRLNVIDFGGLFSGNAIAPARTFALRLDTSF